MFRRVINSLAMKMSVLNLVILVTTIYYSAALLLGGEFAASVTGIDNKDELPRDKCDWYIGFRKESRNKTVFFGYFRIIQPVSNLEVEYDVLKRGNDNKYSKTHIDAFSSSKMSLCNKDVREKWVFGLFTGNVTWTDDKNGCHLSKGVMAFKTGEDLDINRFMHQFMPKCMYGFYMVTTRVYDGARRHLGGITVWVTVERKTSKKH